jgi:hypothetical protein
MYILDIVELASELIGETNAGAADGVAVLSGALVGIGDALTASGVATT